MTNHQRDKVRFVKCPKCANILQEPEHCPLYACGGCETILQAKCYSGDGKATKSGSLEQGVVQSKSDGHGSDDGEPNSSSQRSSSRGEASTDQNGCYDKNDALLSEESTFLHNQDNGFIDNETDLGRSDHAVNQNGDHLETVSSAIEESSEGMSMSVLENKDSEQLAAENPVVEDNSTDGKQNPKQIVVAESANTDASAPNENEVIENNELSRYAEGHTVLDDMESQNSVSNEATENEDNSMVSENKERFEVASEKGTVHDESDSNSPGETTAEKLKGEESRGDVQVDEIHYLEVERLPEVTTLAKEDDGEKHQNEVVECTREQHESMNHSEASSSVVVDQGVNNSKMEGIESNLVGDSLVTASIQHLTDLQTTKDTGSVDVLQEHQWESNTMDIHSETSRRSESHDDFAGPQHVKSPNGPEILRPVNTHREVTGSLEAVPVSSTKGALAYDGSISSFDGNDEQALEQHENIPEDSLPGNGAVAGHVGVEESPEWGNDPSSRIYRSPRTQRQTKSPSQELLNGKMKSVMLEEEESVGENVIPERNRRRRNRERFQARVPFYPSPEVAYETGSSSSYIHDELPPRMHHHPYIYEDLEPEPQLRNMHNQQGNTYRRSYDEYRRDNEFLSKYYSYDTSGEIHHRSGYHNHIDRRWRRESWHQNGRYQMQDPYLHRRPDNDYWWSAQAPVSGVYRRQGLYASPSREVEWDPYDSSLQRFVEYEHYPWARDPVPLSDDQRRKGQTMMRLYSKEKRHTMRRYFQPMAGGAPFITCSFCFNVLQLPEDFLVSRNSKRETHLLRCGDCSKILEFALDNTSTLAPCKPNVRNTDTHYHVNHSRGSSSAPEESRGSEKINIDPKNSWGIEREQRSDNAAVSSSQTKGTKVTWKLTNRKSPLHRLMGYSSPNVLLDGHENEEAER